jgi:hypothetical protein
MDSKRILVAASLTTGRDAAFERGLALARASGAEMYLLHAVPAHDAFSADAMHRLERIDELRSRASRPESPCTPSSSTGIPQRSSNCMPLSALWI